MAFSVCGFTEKERMVLQRQTVNNACEAVISAMIDALPEDAQTMEVFEYILQKSQEFLREKVIKLNL